jgi:hypothetical protein
MQPEVSTGKKQNWQMAVCGYGVALALHHRVHNAMDASQKDLRFGTGFHELAGFF